MRSNKVIHSLLWMICTFVCLTQSCKNEVTLTELEEYIRDGDHGTKKSYEEGDFKAEIVYRPTDLIVSQELNNRGGKKEEIEQTYNKYYYFIISLKKNDKDLLNSTKDRAAFSRMNEQFSFNLGEYIFAVNEFKDTCKPTDYAFPRLYEISKATAVIVAFDKAKLKSDQFKICVKGAPFTSEIIEFDFDQKDFAKIPTLKF